MKKIFKATIVLALGFQCKAQTNETVNHGIAFTRAGTLISCSDNFTNETAGNFINNGEFHFLGDYTNKGLFTFSTNSNSGYVVFEGKNNTIQNITGNSPSFFYDILFNKPGKEKSFELSNEIESSGNVNFLDGIVWINNIDGGSFTFLNGANQTNASKKSFVDGFVSKHGNNAFKFPIGKSQAYRFASISAPANIEDQYKAEYFLENSNLNYPHRNKTGVINIINDKEYWVVNQEVYNKKHVILSLSWDESITPSELISENIDNLHIVRWDSIQKLWVDEGGIIDFQNKTVTTPVEVDGFGVFTLGTIKPKLINPGDVVVYDGVSPDDDGINDYLIIDNINLFPNNSVQIFNRWGVEIYKTTNYNIDNNVFRGFSNTGGSFGTSKMLPTGTYYYVIEYEYDRNGESYMVRKAGYLHLESTN